MQAENTDPVSGPESMQDEPALHLMQTAAALISAGNWDKAAGELEKAAALHKQAGRSYDEVRCLQLAASLSRFAGFPGRAKTLLDTAVKIPAGETPLALSVLCEKAEMLYARGELGEAWQVWTEACRLAGKISLHNQGVSTLLRKRAVVSLLLGKYDASSEDFSRAFNLLEASPDPALAPWVRVEQAFLLLQQGFKSAAHTCILQAEAALEKWPPDLHITAEIWCFKSQYAYLNSEAVTAVAFGLKAQEAALKAVAPLSYYKACTLLSKAYDLDNNKIRAYGVLAATWATLGDLLGREIAGSWVEPCLLALHALWGKDEFQKAKAGYETSRRGKSPPRSSRDVRRADA